MRHVLCAALCVAAACSTPQERLKPIADGWYLDPGADGQPSPHLYGSSDGSRRIVDRQILASHKGSGCVFYEAVRPGGPVLFAAAADRIPLAIAQSDSLRPWYFDPDAIRRYEPTSEGTRRFIDVEVFKLFDTCQKAATQPRLHDAWAAAPLDLSRVTAERESFDVDQTDGVGNTALHDAVREGPIGRVDALLTVGADVNTANAAGITPLMIAAAFHQPEAAERLVRAGSHVNAASEDGMTALMFAARHRAHDSARMLLREGADASMRDSKGRTAADWVSASDEKMRALLASLAPASGGR